MVSITRMSTITLSIPSRRISMRSILPCQRSVRISPSPPVSEMCMACILQATSSSTLSCSPSTKTSMCLPSQPVSLLTILSVKEKIGGSNPKPVFLVFHGGSGSSKAEARIHCLPQYAELITSSSPRQSPMALSKSTLTLTFNGPVSIVEWCHLP